MPKKTTVDVSFALALMAQEGVGRVTAHRLLERFPTYDALLGYPQEQVLLRMKGAPRAERIVGRLFEREAFGAAVTRAADEVRALASKHIDVLAEGHPHWPTGVAALNRSNRPVVLYVYGPSAVLAAISVALHARPPLDGAAFEASQLLARKLISEGIPIVCGAQSGFDVVVQKLCTKGNAPCTMVANCGLACIDAKVRASIATAVKTGSVLVSSFPPQHGPFDHDDSERVLLQTALAYPSVFVSPKSHTPEAHALTWAIRAERPVFGIVGKDKDEALVSLDHVHVVERAVDYDWVVAAARTGEGA